jgi:hypothetical protein
MDAEGYYARLGVPPDADASAITAAYRAKARLLHPDVPETGDAGAFILLHEAYEVLGDEFTRARYDRQSRNHAEREPAPKWSEPPRSDPPPPPPLPELPSFLSSRQLRVGLLAGLIVLTVVSVSELAIHVVRMAQAPLPPRLESLYQTPEAGPSLQPTGTPTHYVLPTGGTAPLWRYDPAQRRYFPAAHLEPFSGVAVLDTPPRDGMVEIRVTSGQGFIDATRLAPGGKTAARAAFCSYNAGPPLTTGEVLARHGNGDGMLRIDNTNPEPVVLKLRDAQGTTAVSVFASQGVTRVDGLPPGQFTAEYATGTLWSRACGSFIAGERTWRLPDPVLVAADADVTVPAQTAAEISPDAFSND